MSSSFSPVLTHPVEDSEHWLPAGELLAHLDVQPAMSVAEIGAGIAYYAIPIARRTGPKGPVFAIEWRPWLLDELHARLVAPQTPRNIRFVEGRAADTHLPAASCDIILFADIWHELEHPDLALAEARRVLRPNGRLAILNWRPDVSCPPGPPVEHRVSMQKTICAVELKQWSLLEAINLQHDGYLVLFEPTDESVQS
ncbi:MAG: class I SAM-dependent methyltransferase [Bryobacterales bacterium]|nr:class I SAM-dependent methyltransferase [Bryobacterales bacterium]